MNDPVNTPTPYHPPPHLSQLLTAHGPTRQRNLPPDRPPSPSPLPHTHTPTSTYHPTRSSATTPTRPHHESRGTQTPGGCPSQPPLHHTDGTARRPGPTLFATCPNSLSPFAAAHTCLLHDDLTPTPCQPLTQLPTAHLPSAASTTLSPRPPSPS